MSRWILPCVIPLAACGRLGFDPAARAPVEPDATPATCPAATLDTLALFAFDGDTIDATGGLAAAVVGSVRFVAGPTDCGEALDFDGNIANHVVVDDSPRWDLDAGTLAFWLQVRSFGVDHGVITRDQSGTAIPGHFNIEVDRGGRLGVRVQTTTDVSIVCTEDVLPLATWVHVEVRFGAPQTELALDGVRQLGTGTLPAFEGAPCDTGKPFGIAGNDLPWVIGANSGRSDGMLNGLDQPLDGMIDHVTITATR